MEEVTWEACENRDEVKAFYIRAGVLAAAAYILGIGDLHYENIIAHGEFPVIVDVETLFQHMDPLYEWTEKNNRFLFRIEQRAVSGRVGRPEYCRDYRGK